MSQNLSKELNTRKLEITSALDDLGITSVRVEWSGGGDSGQVDSIDAKDDEQDTEIDLEKAGIREIDEVYEESIDSGKKNKDGSTKYVRVKRTRKVTKNLHEIIEQFAYDLWDHFGQGGWYNNDGGFGHMEFVWDKKKKVWNIEFEHSNNYTESKVEVSETL
jgi:hypothetical protein